MSLNDVPGQERTKRLLKQLARAGKIPHAMLFSGMTGVGKLAVAREFAKAVNCLEPQDHDSCDRCSSCRKANDGLHPDLVFIRRDGAFIKLDQIRELRGRVRFRPFEGKFRVIILENAQDLNEEAGNALLKLLEEPPRANLFLLTVIEPQMLLPTIVSRCSHLRLQPLEDAMIAQELTASLKIPEAQARELTRLSGGSLERARWLARDDHLSQWKAIPENMQKLGQSGVADLLSMTAQWSQKKEGLEQDLECVKLWVRDLLLSRLIQGYRQSFEAEEQTATPGPEVSVEDLSALYDQVEESIGRLRGNANKQLVIEGLCLTIKDVLYGKSNWNSLP
jgi:DNA polymerase III subunit delta'